MIGFASLTAGIVLLLSLLGLATKGWLASRRVREAAPARADEDVVEPCPEEFVRRVFSRADWEFVRSVRAGSIERLFDHERKQVALMWVRQTSATIRRVIGEHAESARHTKNLEFSTEIKILSQFLALMIVCGVLSIAIQTAGPVRLSGLAHFAQKLSDKVTKQQESFQASVLTRARQAGAA
jgi:hypothetical protein